MFPAVPVPPPKPVLLAELFSWAVVVQDEMADVSAALRLDAVAPPVPSLAIAAIAAAGMVRELWEVAPARTVAMFVVLKIEAWLIAKKGKKAKGVKYFIFKIFWERMTGTEPNKIYLEYQNVVALQFI